MLLFVREKVYFGLTIILGELTEKNDNCLHACNYDPHKLRSYRLKFQTMGLCEWLAGVTSPDFVTDQTKHLRVLTNQQLLLLHKKLPLVLVLRDVENRIFSQFKCPIQFDLYEIFGRKISGSSIVGRVSSNYLITSNSLLSNLSC